jgi:hypothetical protein
MRLPPIHDDVRPMNESSSGETSFGRAESSGISELLLPPAEELLGPAAAALEPADQLEALLPLPLARLETPSARSAEPGKVMRPDEARAAACCTGALAVSDARSLYASAVQRLECRRPAIGDREKRVRGGAGARRLGETTARCCWDGVALSCSDC